MNEDLGSAPDPTSSIELRMLFRKHDFRPRRRLGQTFLVDGNVVRKIVEATALTGEDAVFEVGAGAGAVTRALSLAAGRVVALEIDPTLVSILGETVGGAAEVLEGDVLRIDWQQVFGDDRTGRWRVVANLPYAITGPAILRLLAARDWVERMVIMVQREVAERLVATPGGRERGLLSVLVLATCEAELVRRVSRTCFYPRPRVDSAIVRMTVRRPPLVPPPLEEAFQEVVRAAFGTRRKTLLNALAQAEKLRLARPEVRDVLAAAGIEHSRRAETLSVSEFVLLAGETTRVRGEQVS